MDNHQKITLTTFTDPMMGLSYECEPMFRKLETHFAGKIAFKYVMSGLVHDVGDFMLPEEMSLPAGKGIRTYNMRLAKIYESEEAIGGMPICMEGFRLFDEEHRSSYPLNIAYKAVQLIAPDKADLFLYNLRYATIAKTRQTTLTEELASVAEDTGIDKDTFLKAFTDGTAAAAFQKDLGFTRSLGIHSLPAYLVEHGGKKLLINAMVGYKAFVSVIEEISGGTIRPSLAADKTAMLTHLLAAHPLISSLELMAALDMENAAIFDQWALPILSGQKARILKYCNAWFALTNQ